MEKAVVLKKITKRFPGIVANDRIDLEVEKGEIHAIVGENGAGKSTLMKILAGIYQPDEGEIYIFGKREKINSPGRAIELKIGMVHQHFMLVDRFTVLENIILGAEKSSGIALDEKRCRKAVEELLALYNFSLNLDARVEEISVGQAQRVEILKVLYRGADILVLDEPTAVLAPQEVRELFNNLRRLKSEGKTIIFISHKLEEVLEIADHITVLRRGKVVGTAIPSQVTKEDLARMMVGKPVMMRLDKEPLDVGEVLLSIEDLVVKESSGRPLVNGISLKIRGGEIYGIAGIEGNGQKELAEAIIGLRTASAGRIRVCGRDIAGLSIKEIRNLGVAFIPEDRHRQGLVLPMKVWENMMLGYHTKKDFLRGRSLNLKAIRGFTKNKVEEYGVRLSSIEQSIEGLSGGNQQKVILGRELSRGPKIIVASQPTRGLDVGAAEFVHKELLKMRKKGSAILFISADLEEVLSISDRVGVIYNGKITAEFRPEEVTPEDIGVYMLGGEKGAGEAK
ncbi:nucleoside ABC transporter ATP-binding protein [Caldanaerovirga acetigignens]|uniref:Nucleoside ABC transporter ATP-binding protein n=1 Tax=Caldanaerovirga acetigignens TaxID=447595 RepID=A0A1M7LUB0_9FIRM|nr:ABC transporter ATP-binding protein [Caldanaerovirga acetigignens]SHM81805.1 nucleoside ABC transporter ATP-binding protein [Caldanaerovirga acetigignens]